MMVALSAVTAHAINVACPTFHPVESYGHVACALSDGLQQRGFIVNEIGGHGRTKRLSPVTGGFLLGYPTNFAKFGALTSVGKRVAITMFESTCLPDGWVESLNRCDAVIVPAQFLVEVFKNAGVIVPIHVVPLGVDAVYTQIKRRYVPRVTPLTVLTIWDRGNRKNGQMAALAFNRAFGDNPRYQFIGKSRTGAYPLIDGFTNPNMHLVQADYSEAQMAALYRRCHIMLFPTRGEGFGLPPREFAATGGVALATDWGGTADELSSWGVALQTRMEPAWQYQQAWYGKLGDWAAPQIDDMVAKLQMIAGDYRTYARQAMNAAAFVRQNYTWDRFVEGCLNVYASL
jgi:glycosyltransferase involved in cell wall biosynthesis